MPCLFADLQRGKHRENSGDHHKQSDFTVGRLEPASLVWAQQETFMVQDHKSKWQAHGHWRSDSRLSADNLQKFCTCNYFDEIVATQVGKFCTCLFDGEKFKACENALGLPGRRDSHANCYMYVLASIFLISNPIQTPSTRANVANVL